MAGIAALAVGLISAGVGAYQAYETKQDRKAALKQAEETRQEQIKKRSKQILSKQKASFLASGIAITGEGSTQDFFDDTYLATQADAQNVSDYYETQIGNVTGEARSQYIGALGSAVGSATSYYSSVKTQSTQASISQGAN